MIFAVINGPNLNLLGRRQPHIYGNQSFEVYWPKLEAAFSGHQLTYFQSNAEGALIDELHRIGFDVDGIVLNAGAYTHTSLALADAIASIEAPVVEVHLSNIFAREPIRQHSLIAASCQGSISGFSLQSYDLGLQALIGLLSAQ
ncbi:MAG: type II 3-dehydroquinate dehydratase [Aureispira sp.]